MRGSLYSLVLQFAILLGFPNRSIRLAVSYNFLSRSSSPRLQSIHLRVKTATKSNVEGLPSIPKGKTLVIVESPAKARTIQRFLDESTFHVDYCAGHVRDLPSSSKSVPDEYKKDYILRELNLKVSGVGIDVKNNFNPIYVPLESKADIVKRLTKLSKSCSSILLATDEDREGEAISWHLLELLNPKVPYKRAVFHEITKDAIMESFSNPRDIDMDIVQSQVSAIVSCSFTRSCDNSTFCAGVVCCLTLT